MLDSWSRHSPGQRLHSPCTALVRHTPWSQAHHGKQPICRQVGIPKRRRITNAAGNKWNWMENAACTWGRQCTLLQGMGLYKRKQPDLEGIFSISHSPISPANHHCKDNGLNSHCSPHTAFIFPQKSFKTKQQQLSQCKCSFVLVLNCNFWKQGNQMKAICKWSLISAPTHLQCTHSFALVLSRNVLQCSSELLPHN